MRGSSLPQLFSELHENITDVFNKNNVEIMTPIYQTPGWHRLSGRVIWRKCP